MSKQFKTTPRFANEAEERAFWGKHDSSEYVDWTKAKRVTMPNLKPTTKTISLRLPQHLLDSIKTAANARDVPYQSLIKVALRVRVWVKMVMELPERLTECGFQQIDTAAETGMISGWLLYANTSF
ncbi:MAG TPA: BrnA antitoxin family protein, partial [Gallionella sp.]|nr:BrnA antitoxin family protein [Gallionella sp.]